MKRILFSALLLVSALMASAFDNQYRIVSKMDNGTETACSGVITLTGVQNHRGMVDYNGLTIYLNDFINYEWPLNRKLLIDESTIELWYYDTIKIAMRQTNDSVYIFSLPMFYGQKQGTVVYKAIFELAKEDLRKNEMHGLFDSGVNTVGAGYGKNNGASWSVAGRNLQTSLAKPVYNSNSEGTVVVVIRVDESGCVISATKGAGTNTSDPELIKSAIKAAQMARFSKGVGVAVGTITYVFKIS